MQKITVSIIIVAYKAEKELLQCLQSIQKQKTRYKYEIIVVDNNETEGLYKKIHTRFPSVKIERPEKNKGYGGGNNYGAKEAHGEYLFILNPDTELLPHCIDELIQFLQNNPKTGVVAPILLNQQKKRYPIQGTHTLTPLRGIIALSWINKAFPKNSISSQYWVDVSHATKPVRVDVVPGTAFVISKKLFFDCGMFDEHFFLYFEESDLCDRVRQKGYLLSIVPSAQAVHLWGRSTKGEPSINHIFQLSRFYYFKKHYGTVPAFFVELFARQSKKGVMLILLCFLLVLFGFLVTHRF